MNTIKLINNIVLDKGELRAIGRGRKLSRVFCSQGDLDMSCTTYCLLMMLILNKRLDWNDIINDKCPQYIVKFKKAFLSHFNGIASSENNLDDLCADFNKVCSGHWAVVSYSTSPVVANCVPDYILQMKIKEYLDARLPVQICFSRQNRTGHSVVAIGYMDCGKFLRLFCLDPARKLPNSMLWNNVIDMFLNISSTNKISDYNHFEKCNVDINAMLVLR